jgi:GT2 family glycosyltransferase
VKQPNAALHYFDLRFDDRGLMRITELGVWFRSRILGIPFGDQALCLPAEAFRSLGGYDETVDQGEDHRLVRRARQAGLPLRPVGVAVFTSARKYRRQGWLRTTVRHLWLTARESLRR